MPRPRLLAGVTSSHFGPSVATSDDLGASWDEPDEAPVAFPADTGVSLGRVWQLMPGRSRRAGRGLGRHRAVGAVPVHRRWPQLRAGPFPLGPPAPPAVGGRLRRAGRCTRAAAPARPGSGAGGHVHRRGLPHGGRRRDVGAGQHRHPRLLHARPVAGVRPVRAQGRPGRRRPRAAVRAEPPRRLPLRRRRRAPGPRSPTGCPATSASRWWPTRAAAARSGPSRWWPTASGSRPTTAAGCSAPPTPAASGSRCRSGCPRARSIRRCCATRCAPTTPAPAGVYFGTRSGEVFASRDEGDSWSSVAAHLPDVLCVRAAEV